GRLNRRIRRRVNARDVHNLVPRRLEFGILAIHEVAVLDAVVIHQREAVDISFLGDGAGFGWGDVRSADGSECRTASETGCSDGTGQRRASEWGFGMSQGL